MTTYKPNPIPEGEEDVVFPKAGKRGNEPAFPIQDLALSYGLTKREYIAALAMQGFAHLFKHGRLETVQVTAYESVVLADALLAELEKE